MQKKLIHLVCGARPNFMKIAPLYRALKDADWTNVAIIHTGQHYDYRMSRAFFEDLDLPEPSVFLSVGTEAKTQGAQTAEVIRQYEAILLDQRPDATIVVGDVNSTLGAAIAVSKTGTLLAHVEAGLRSFDRGMPEEINRVVVDAISRILFASTITAVRNLQNESVEGDIEHVGNVMIDSLVAARETFEKRSPFREYGLREKAFGVVTLHRPSNTDNEDRLVEVLGALEDIHREVMPLICPIHPRFQRQLRSIGLKYPGSKGIVFVEPMAYLDFLATVSKSAFVITDSGGIQEETTFMRIKCFTLRNSTERPETLTVNGGTNVLMEPGRLKTALEQALGQDGEMRVKLPVFWDGLATGRIIAGLKTALEADVFPQHAPLRDRGPAMRQDRKVLSLAL
jgi:UDP-N-acetylglucosamine 2-epimerase (non-hydrolysing)